MLDLDQVHALSPDPRTLARAQRVARQMGKWSALGRSEVALWGSVQGSTTYGVQVDLQQLAFSCSCPVRRPPCKHALALLLLAAEHLDSLPRAQEPPTVAQWLAGRRQRAANRAERAEKTGKPVDLEQQGKRVAAREERIADGLSQLELWLGDVARRGLGQVDAEQFPVQAARLVDAQAAGLAARVRGLEGVVGIGRDWPERLAERLGRLALMVHAYRRQEQLPEEVRAEIRARVGWAPRRAEVLESGEQVRARWAVLGQMETEVDNGTSRRTWLVAPGGRTAVIRDFAPDARPFFERTYDLGTELDATLVFYPGSLPDRALLLEEFGEPSRLSAPPSGLGTLAELLDARAEALALDPWALWFPAVLEQVQPVFHEGRWFLLDQTGASLPLVEVSWWSLMAATVGRPTTVFAVLNGSELRVHGAWVEGSWTQAGPG
jgi:hypothetical protein